jgi:hypothetical protein
MTSLFKTPKMPGPDPELAKAQRSQEQRLEAEEASKMRQIAASRRSRRYGGMRMLLSKERETPELGIQSTFGPMP